MSRPRTLLFLLFALFSVKFVDSCFPRFARSPWGLVQLAVAATPPEGRGPRLAVVVMRPGSDPRPVAATGQTITISVAVNNLLGNSDAHSAVLTVKLAPGLTFQSATPPPDSVEGASSLVWKLGTIPAGALPLTVDLNLVIASDVPPAAGLTVSANVATSDPNLHLEDSSDRIILVVEPAAANLGVGSNLDAVPLTVAEPVTFTAEVSNQGTTVATASSLALTLPPMITFKSSDSAAAVTSSDDRVSWQLGDIEPGGSRAFAITVYADNSLGAIRSDLSSQNLLKFTLDASTATNQVNPANAHLEIEKYVEPAGSNLKVWLNLTGTDNPDELQVGRDATYTLTYGNFGNQPAQHTSVSLSLAEGLNLVRATPPVAHSGKSDKFGGGVLSWDVGDLRVGQSDNITIQVHVAAVPPDGSLVMATITTLSPNVDSDDNVAYSRGYAPRVAGLHSAITHAPHLLRWILITLTILALLWVGVRVRRRHAVT